MGINRSVCKKIWNFGVILSAFGCDKLCKISGEGLRNAAVEVNPL